MLNQQFSAVRNLRRHGDMSFTRERNAWKGERAALALGAEVRFPPVTRLNFSWFRSCWCEAICRLVVSSQILSHVNVGYEPT